MTTETGGATSTTDTSSTTGTSSPEAGGAVAGGAGGGAPAAKFWESFGNEALRVSPNITKYETPEALAAAHEAAIKHIGVSPDHLIRLPTDPNDKAAWGDVFKRLGRPDTPEGYKIALPENASDQDKALGAGFAKIMHETGATPAQVEAAIGWWNEQTVQAARTRETMAAEADRQGVEAVRKEWGGAYDQRMKEVGNLLNRFGGPELVKELEANGMGSNPRLALALGKILDAVAEPGLPGLAGDAGGGARPMTPTQARAARVALEADTVKGAALMNRDHPMHKAIVAERMKLIEAEAARG